MKLSVPVCRLRSMFECTLLLVLHLCSQEDLWAAGYQAVEEMEAEVRVRALARALARALDLDLDLDLDWGLDWDLDWDLGWDLDWDLGWDLALARGCRGSTLL